MATDVGHGQLRVTVGADVAEAVRRLADTPGLRIEPLPHAAYRITRTRRPAWALWLISRSQTCVMTLGRDGTAALSGPLAPALAERLREIGTGSGDGTATTPSGDAPVRDQVPVRTARSDVSGAATSLRSAGPRAFRTAPAPVTPRLGGAATATPVVTLDDGRQLTLRTTLLLGRDPVPDTGETGAQPVPVDDPGRSVSKTHCAVGLDPDASVWVTDRHSVNGITITDNAGVVHACPPGTRVPVPPGATVHFGERSFTVQSGRR